MVLITSSGPETMAIGSQAPAFELPGTDGLTYGLRSFSEAKGLVLVFTCNHCPYAKAYEDRLIALARAYQPKGIDFAAINPNDAESYPEDRFENMKARAAEKGFPFPYLRDESQATARAYGAVCTPHFFVLDRQRRLVYEGRLDDNWKEPDKATRRDLQDALDDLLAGRPVSAPNTPPMGCSIKWKNA